MTSEIQSTIAEIRANINLSRACLSRLEVNPADTETLLEMMVLTQQLWPLLKQLEALYW